MLRVEANIDFPTPPLPEQIANFIFDRIIISKTIDIFPQPFFFEFFLNYLNNLGKLEKLYL